MIPSPGELDAAIGFACLLTLFVVAGDVIDDLRWFAQRGRYLAKLLRR